LISPEPCQHRVRAKVQVRVRIQLRALVLASASVQLQAHEMAFRRINVCKLRHRLRADYRNDLRRLESWCCVGRTCARRGLHLTHIKFFANGVRLWPSNPIYTFSEHLRYPAGIDFFNALLLKANVDLIPGLVWVGLLASIATFYALYRWGGGFAVAAFLFNGGLAGFQFVKNFQFVDYQDVNNIAWKSIPLTMFVTQRGLLYAIPAGLILLWHWREKYFRSKE